MNLDNLPRREGPRPSTTQHTPHSQLDQHAPLAYQRLLQAHALSLPNVREGVTRVSIPGSVAFFLDVPVNTPDLPNMFEGEWGHIHPAHDGSLHLNVPTVVAEALIEAGWAEYHYLVGTGHLPRIIIMLYGPRNDAELDVAKTVVETAYIAAGGATHADDGRELAALHRSMRDSAPSV